MSSSPAYLDMDLMSSEPICLDAPLTRSEVLYEEYLAKVDEENKRAGYHNCGYGIQHEYNSMTESDTDLVKEDDFG